MTLSNEALEAAAVAAENWPRDIECVEHYYATEYPDWFEPSVGVPSTDEHG